MNELKKVGKLLISDYELSVLNKYGIKINKNSSIDEVLFLIDMYLNDAYDLTNEEYDEIDYVANTLMERKYYMETNK